MNLLHSESLHLLHQQTLLVSLDPPSDQAAVTTRDPGLSQPIASKRLTCPVCLSLVLGSHRVQRLGGQFMGALADPRRY